MGFKRKYFRISLLFFLLLATSVFVSFESFKNVTAASPDAFFYDAYYYLEDFDGDGFDDGMDVWFDVDIDTMNTVSVTDYLNVKLRY